MPAGGERGVVPVPVPSRLRELRARGGLRGVLPLLGPAFVAAVAYVDPGNFATNVAGGSRYGYLLIWAVLGANLMAMLIQYLAAKVGIATGRNLAELCREHFPRPLTLGLWVQAEVIAMATDLAEVLGAAIALNLLLGIPLLFGGLIGGAGAFALLSLHALGYRRFEAAIIALLAVILLVFFYETLKTGPDPGGVAGGFVPHLQGTGSLLLAVGMIGATVMPHVIYLHSALTQDRIVARDDAERVELGRFQRLDVMIAMSIAGVVNLSMLAVMASLFFHGPGSDAATIEEAHAGLQRLVGGAAALAFALSLLASGLSAERRHLRRPDRHAGVHPQDDPALAAPRDHIDPGAGRPRDRRRPHLRPRPVAGCALVRDSLRADPARDLHTPTRADGRACQPAADNGGRHSGRNRHRLAERVPARGDLCRVTASTSPLAVPRGGAAPA